MYLKAEVIGMAMSVAFAVVVIFDLTGLYAVRFEVFSGGSRVDDFPRSLVCHDRADDA